MAKSDLARKFGMSAVKKGFATKEQIEEALKEQERLSSEGKTVLISDILIESGVLTLEQRDEIIQYQENLKEHLLDKEAEEKIKGGKKVQDDSGFELTITSDRIEAYICPVEDGLPEVNLETIKNLLKMEGINHGVADDARISEYLSTEPTKDKLWKIAQGKPPDPGQPAQIKYHFDTEPLKAATIDENGNIDYKNRGKIPYVQEEELLAEIIPATEGKSGRDIYGEEALPPEHPIVELLCGINVKKIEEGSKAISEMKGRPELLQDGSICVTDTLEISGDIGIQTGHIEFDGHIKVRGGVQEGYKVKGKSLITDEILNAEVEITENIVVAKGIIGAKVFADGEVKAKHVRDSTIDALGDVTVEKEVYESHIETNGVFKIERGTIMGSFISAMKGVEALEVGSAASDPCTILTGIDNRLEKQVTTLNMQIAEKEKEREALKQTLVTLRDLPEKLEEEIGEKAQTQDRAMVKGRTLKQTLQSLQEANDRKNMIKVLKIIKGFNTKLEQLQKELDDLLKKQEHVEEEIESKKAKINEIDTKIVELQDDIKSLLEIAKIRQPSAGIKATGSIYDRTLIKGRNASLMVKGTLHKVLVQEVKNEGEQKDSDWVMAVTKL